MQPCTLHFAPRQPFQLIIVEKDQTSVGSSPHVELDHFRSHPERLADRHFGILRRDNTGSAMSNDHLPFKRLCTAQCNAHETED